MMVTYRERHFLDKYRCIDRYITKYFDSKWQVNNLIYFKVSEYNIFCIAIEDIVQIDEKKECIKMNNNNKKWYSIELNQTQAEQLKTYLKNNNIYFEPSSCYNLIHIEVKASNEEVEKINKFLDTI